MYRYETHCHTLYASACSSLDAETMVALYLANGYDGIVVTDHFFNGNTAISPSLGWKERVGAFYGAYMNVRKEGEKRGLKVFFGFEYSYSGTDFLAYGMGPDFLCRHPEMMALSVKSWLAFAKKAVRCASRRILTAKRIISTISACFRAIRTGWRRSTPRATSVATVWRIFSRTNILF